jgi:hypothetical protein
MTKTLTAVGPYRYGNLCPLVIMLFGTNAGGSGVWNFEFGSLEFVWNFGIWFLVLGIFMIFIKQVTFVYSVNYLFK